MARALSNKDAFDMALNCWKDAVQQIVKVFVSEYFDEDAEIWWVADQIGGVVHINDFFFGVNEMIEFLENGYTQDEMIKYYYYSLEEKNPVKISVWLKQ